MTDTHIANALAFVTKLQLKWQDEAAAAAPRNRRGRSPDRGTSETVQKC